MWTSVHFGKLHYKMSPQHVTFKVMGNVFWKSTIFFRNIFGPAPNLWHHAIFSFTSGNHRLSYIVLTLPIQGGKPRWCSKLSLQWLATCRFAWMGNPHSGSVPVNWRRTPGLIDLPPKWPLWKQLHTTPHLFVRTPTGQETCPAWSAVLPGSCL